MNIEKIVNDKIKNYKLEGLVDYNWFLSLNNTQQTNFLELYLVPSKILDYKDIIINEDLLNSTYYVKDINLINGARTNEIASCISTLVGNKEFINSKNHSFDVDAIFNAKTFVISRYLYGIASNTNLSNNPYHRIYMNYISNAKNDEVAYYLCKMAHYPQNEYTLKDAQLVSLASDNYKARLLSSASNNKVSIESGHHKIDMNLIFNANSYTTAKCIYNAVTNKDLVKSKYFTHDINLIKEAKEIYKIENLHILSTDKDSLNSDYHKCDILLLNKCENEIVSKYLLDVARNVNSLNSIYHASDMNLLSKCSEDNVYFVYLLAVNEKSLKDPDHADDIISIFNTKTKEDAKKIYEKIVSKFDNIRYVDSNLKTKSNNLKLNKKINNKKSSL